MDLFFILTSVISVSYVLSSIHHSTATKIPITVYIRIYLIILVPYTTNSTNYKALLQIPSMYTSTVYLYTYWQSIHLPLAYHAQLLFI